MFLSLLSHLSQRRKQMKKKQNEKTKSHECVKKPDAQAVGQHHEVPKGKCPMRFIVQDDKIKSVTFKNPKKEFIEDCLSHMQELTATKDAEIAGEIHDRALAALPKNNNLEHRTNLIIQSLADAQPQDSIEAKLCMQETVLYANGMQYLSRAENTERFEHNEFYMKNAIKLLRLHNETIELLMRYRRGGEQRVVVQHVNVSDGAQAIVGNVITGGGSNIKSDEVIP